MFRNQKVLFIAIHNYDFNNPTTIDISYKTFGVAESVQTKQGEIGVLLLILIIAVAILGLVNLLIFMRLKNVKSSHLKMYVN